MAPLVIGLGNEHRGDDAFGLVVARRLRPRLMGVGAVLEPDVGGAELLDVWTGRGRVWVVDAMRAGGAPGTVYRIEVGEEALASPARRDVQPWGIPRTGRRARASAPSTSEAPRDPRGRTDRV